MRNAIFSNYQPGGMFSLIDVDKHPGNVWFVDSGHSSKSNSDGYGQNPDAPFATIDYAIGKCTANNGDVIYPAPGHTETLSAASTITADVAGISIIGLGEGNDRPKIIIGTDAAATIAISAASVAFKNIIVIGALDGLNSALTITGDDYDIDIEYRDTSAAVEANIAITATSVDRGKIKLNYIGFIAGNAVTNAIVLDGCTSCDVDVAFYGVASTAIVQFLNNACHNINIKGYFYNSGTTNLSKNVVDTPTGSTWAVAGFDGAAGCGFSGGSGASGVQKDDVGAVAALIGTPAASVSADIAAIKLQTDELGAAVGADISADIAAVGTLIGTPVVDVSTDIAALDTKIGTPAVDLAADIAALNNISAADVNAEVDTALDTIVPAAPTAGSVNDILSKASGGNTFNKATDSLEALADSILLGGVKTTSMADSTVIPDNNQAAGGLLGTATGGAVMIEEIIVQRGAVNAAGPTNYRFSTDNVNGLTGKAAPFGSMVLAKFNANLTSVLSIDGTVKQLPYVLESGKKLYIDGDNAATTGAVATDFYIKYRRLAAGATLA